VPHPAPLAPLVATSARKRASLITLGLAKRKSSKSKGDETPVADGSEVANPAKTDAL